MTTHSSFQKHTAQFHYDGKDIGFHFWSNTGDTKPDAVVFLGAGQIGSIPRWVVRNAGAHVVAVEGLPYWEANATAEDIGRLSKAYVASALGAVLATFSLPSIHIIAESQAAPGSVITALTLSSKVQNVALVRPLGFSVQALGATEAERLKTFRKRVLETTAQLTRTLFRDPRNLGVGLVMLRTAFRERTLADLAQKYAIGISYDLLEECHQLAERQAQKGASLTILLGADDKLFPAAEVRAALSSKGISKVAIEVLPHTTHGSLATRLSKNILHRALHAVRANPSARVRV